MNYFELANDATFLEHSKKLANKIERVISLNYLSDNEVEIVKKIVDEINVNTMDTRSISKTIISTRAIFVHGYKISQQQSKPSGVEFECYGVKTHKELSDIIFEAEIFDKSSLLQKITFNQVKKSKVNEKSQVWNIDEEQLYLLSKFPSFTGVPGSFIPQNNYYLANNSENLGSYGLLYAPGDFAYISAIKLSDSIKNKKSININELYEIKNQLKNVVKNYSFLNESTLSNFSNFVAGDIYDFVNKYMLCSIGETINAKNGNVNISAKYFYNHLLDNISRQEPAFHNFISFFMRNYEAPIYYNSTTTKEKDENSGFAIISTKIFLNKD